MKRVHFTLIAAILALATYPLVMAQGDDGYNEWLVPPIDSQTKNLPAGTVGSPGSELLFILDTGVDANSLYEDDDDFESDGVSEHREYHRAELPELYQRNEHQSD